jgi:hypothetical protein
MRSLIMAIATLPRAGAAGAPGVWGSFGCMAGNLTQGDVWPLVRLRRTSG